MSLAFLIVKISMANIDNKQTICSTELWAKQKSAKSPHISDLVEDIFINENLLIFTRMCVRRSQCYQKQQHRKAYVGM